MAGRSPAEAVTSYLQALQLALSCVTPAVLNVSGGYYISDAPHALVLNRGLPVELRSNPRLKISVSEWYRIVVSAGVRGPWKVSIASYYYDVSDASDRTFFAYHWHPDLRSEVTHPHLHLGWAAQVSDERPANAHLPTSRIALEEVIRLLIREFGVEPLRTDWATVLDETQERSALYRTWA